ncbi:hypothetical protein ACFSQ7_51055 [Paenibacillus rhizoplanae]
MNYQLNAGKRSKWRHITQNPFSVCDGCTGAVVFLVFSYFPIYGIMIAFKDYDFCQGDHGE